MPTGTKPPQAVGKADRRRPASDLAALPQQRSRGRKAAAGPGRQKVAKTDALGPGGLGYVVALEDDEKAGIDWHGQQAGRKAPPRRN